MNNLERPEEDFLNYNNAKLPYIVEPFMGAKPVGKALRPACAYCRFGEGRGEPLYETARPFL